MLDRDPKEFWTMFMERPFQGISHHCGKLFLVLFIVALLIIGGSGSVTAAQTNESWGPGGLAGEQIGYGWQQVWEVTGPATGIATRLTGSADRRWYDWGYKEIQLSGRNENFWGRDCGWWYVSGTAPAISFTLWDADGDPVGSWPSQSTTRGLASITYPWGEDDDPGEWTGRMDDGTLNTFFKLFVRGMLNVTNITTDATNPFNVNTGDAITINASLKDHAGNAVTGTYTLNNGTSAVPTVMLFVTGGGEDFNQIMTDSNDDSGWTTTVTFNNTGDHKMIVAAYDGHIYWVDGRRSIWIYVNGTYSPDYDEYASPVLRLVSYIRDVIESKLPAVFRRLFGLKSFRRLGRYQSS